MHKFPLSQNTYFPSFPDVCQGNKNTTWNTAIKNAETSIGIIEEMTLQNSKDNFKVKNNSIYTLLGVKNGGGIISKIRGIEHLNEITIERKKIVNKLILPKAELNHLVEVEKTATPKTKTKKEKKETTAEKKQNIESDYAVKKADISLKNNAIRTTANNVVFPFIFLASQDSKNYQFKNNRVMINITALDNKIVKAVFNVDKKNIQVEGRYFLACNLTLLIKLSKAVLFNVKIIDTTASNETAEELENAVDEISKGEFDETKEENIVKSISTMLDYLDKNEGFNGLFQIEKHIYKLEEYGQYKAELVNNVRKQGQKKLDVFGTFAVEYDHRIEVPAKTFDEFEENFNKRFAIK